MTARRKKFKLIHSQMTIRNNLKNLCTNLAFPKFLWKKKIPIRSQRHQLCCLGRHHRLPQEAETMGHTAAKGALETGEPSILYTLGITEEKEQRVERRVKMISSTKVPQDLSSSDPIHYKEKGQIHSSPKSEFK